MSQLACIIGKTHREAVASVDAFGGIFHINTSAIGMCLVDIQLLAALVSQLKGSSHWHFISCLSAIHLSLHNDQALCLCIDWQQGQCQCQASCTALFQ